MVTYTFTRLFLYDNWSRLFVGSNVWNHRAFDIQINREREGEQIDQALVKSILAINAENGVGSLKQHKQNLEEAILEDTAAFYSQKASYWMQKKSYNEYMLAVLMLLPFLSWSI